MISQKQLWVLLQEVIYKELKHNKEEVSNQEQMDLIILTMLIDHRARAIVGKDSTNTELTQANINNLSDKLDQALEYNHGQFEEIKHFFKK